MDHEQSRPHRPAPYADLTGLFDAVSMARGDAESLSPSTRAEVASATAALLVQAGRSTDEPVEERFVTLAERVGIDTLAALWRDSDPVSLPGALWALYLMRQWFRTGDEHVRLLWRAGAPLAPAETVVAGVAEPAGLEDLQAAADAVLIGVFRGDVAVSFERAAAIFRVMAAGRRDVPAEHTDVEAPLAARNDRVAHDLAAAARRWRAGTLT